MDALVCGTMDVKGLAGGAVHGILCAAPGRAEGFTVRFLPVDGAGSGNFNLGETATVIFIVAAGFYAAF